MTDTDNVGFSNLAAALEATEYPELDLALRRGRHIDRDDTVLYTYLVDAKDYLEPFYRRFGCELIHKTDGYFYLLPSGDKLRKKHLSVHSMLVGQALALLYLDPTTVQAGGLVDRDQLLAQLDSVVGTDALIRSFNPKRRRYDERVAQETVRKKVTVEVRRLASLGFVEMAADHQIRLRPALLRFAEPVRGLEAPAESLAKLVASGEVALAQDVAADDDGEDVDSVDDLDDADDAAANADDDDDVDAADVDAADVDAADEDAADEDAADVDAADDDAADVEAADVDAADDDAADVDAADVDAADADAAGADAADADADTEDAADILARAIEDQE